jgi:hypothetical protein
LFDHVVSSLAGGLVPPLAARGDCLDPAHGPA